MLLLNHNQIQNLNRILINASLIGQQGVNKLLTGLPHGITNPVINNTMLSMLNHFSTTPIQHDGRYVLEIVLENAISELQNMGMATQANEVVQYLDLAKAKIIERAVQIIQSKEGGAAPQAISGKPTIFLLYAIQDQAEIDFFDRHAFLVLQDTEVFDMHRSITQGNIAQKWKEKIATTDILLVFVSANLFTRPRTEYQFLLDVHDKVPTIIPILLSKVMLGKNITSLKSFPSHPKFVSQWTDKDTAFVDIVKGVENVLKKK